jgi:hypothetical protein
MGAVSRHDVLRLAAAASAGWLVPGRVRPNAAVGQDAAAGRVARVSRVIEEYDGQGIHRTATAVDDRSADWLVQLARRAGAEAATESVPIARVDVRACHVQVGDRRIEGLPLFDGSFTGPAGVAGRLGPPESDAELALITIDGPGISSEGRGLADLRRSARHRAVVAVTDGAHPGLSPSNAASFAAPYGLPVVQVGSADGVVLREQAGRRAPAQVVAHADRTPAAAQNVVATVAGRDGGLVPVVVMTPRSGWWHCAAERGGGIACWLEALAALARAGRPRPALFVASSGHELGHLGLEAFIERRRALVRDAAAWVHLGANIGAAGGRPRLQTSDDEIEARALAALDRAGAGGLARVARGTVPAGEARNIHAGGGRYVSLLGSSPYFHNPADRWPAAVDAPAVARFAGAVADLVLMLADT